MQFPGAGLKVLIIAPGETSLPVVGWGAVEYIVMKHVKVLTDLGFHVIVLNSWHHRDWLRALSMRPSFVILHYDMFSIRWHYYRRFFRIPTLVISHFGYAGFPEFWNSTFRRSFNYFSKFEYIGCLNSEILKTFSALSPDSELVLLPNGSEENEYAQFPTTRFEKFVLIGKVEERKKQIEIVRSLSRPDLVDFIGPIQDRRFASLNQSQKQSFLGEWSRDRIKSELPKYRGLILLSDAEADALVLHEALAAGIEVFVSKNSLGSQEVSQFVHLVHSVEELEQLLTACLARKPFDSSIIRLHAANNSWEKQVAVISNLIYQSS
jgi:glycosyltransferase involved in cell wall biosynthesis